MAGTEVGVMVRVRVVVRDRAGDMARGGGRARIRIRFQTRGLVEVQGKGGRARIQIRFQTRG